MLYKIKNITYKNCLLEKYFLFAKCCACVEKLIELVTKLHSIEMKIEDILKVFPKKLSQKNRKFFSFMLTLGELICFCQQNKIYVLTEDPFVQTAEKKQVIHCWLV